MFSKKLNIVFVLMAIASALMAVFVDTSYSLGLIPAITCVAIVYVFSPQIDWWWYQKHPPQLPEPLKALLARFFPFYQNLSAENKIRFEQRAKMYMEGRVFLAKLGTNKDEDVPEDIKMILSANMVMLTFGREDFILDEFERIIVYMQVFPSPQFPRHLHASEVFEEDRVTIFSAEHLTHSFRSPSEYYNLALHEFAKAFQIVYPNYSYPESDEKIWTDFHFKKDDIIKFIGLPEVDAYRLSVNLFFTEPQRFKELMPDAYKKYMEIFNLDPINTADPIVDHLKKGKF